MNNPYFVDACVKQFKIPHSDPALLMGELEKVTGRLPLVIKTILGLRRHTSSYQQAIVLYQEGAGKDARGYLFQREYDALGVDNRARHLLAALGLFEDPVDFENLRLVLNFGSEQLTDAIGEVSDIFLADDNNETPNTEFELRPVARPFVKEVTLKLDRYGLIETRVRMLRSSSIPDSPQVTSPQRASRSFCVQGWVARRAANA
jgi:hypothetical protein